MEILQGFTKLNKNTKKAKSFIKNFVHAKNLYLWQVYDKPSKRKEKVFGYWWKFYRDLKTSGNFCIPTYNTSTFTIAFTINNTKQLVYITPTNNYIIDLI